MEFDPTFSQGPSQGKKKENPEGTRMILTNHSSRIVYVSMILSTPIFTQIFYTDEAYTTHIILQLCLPRMSRKGNKPILLAMQIPEPFWASSQRSRVSSRSLEDFLWYLFYSARVINHVVKTQEIPASSPVARHHFLWGYLRYGLPLQGFRLLGEIRRRNSSSSGM